MTMGGNKKASAYFNGYGLMAQDAKARLNSEAGHYYRKQLLSQVNIVDFQERAPVREEGVKVKGTF